MNPPLAYALVGLLTAVTGGTYLIAWMLRGQRPARLPIIAPAERDPLNGDHAPNDWPPPETNVPGLPPRPRRMSDSWPPVEQARATATGSHRPTAARFRGHLDTPPPSAYEGRGRHRAVPADESMTRAMTAVRRTR